MTEMDYVRVSILENWRFWHRFGDDYEAAGREAIAEADALLAGDLDGNERAAAMLREAEAFREKKAKAGRLGGFAKSRKQQQITAVRVSGSGDAPVPVTSGRNARPVEASTGPDREFSPGGVPDGNAGDPSAGTTAPGQVLTTTRTRAGESADNGAASLAPANGGSARGERPDAPGATEAPLISSAPDPAPARSRKNLPAVGEFRNVRMSDGERAALVAEFGDVSAIVEELSSYKAATGKTYRNDYAALRNWLRRRKAEGKRPDGRKQTQGERMAEYFARREIEIEMLDRERAGNLPAEYGVTDDESY